MTLGPVGTVAHPESRRSALTTRMVLGKVIESSVRTPYNS